MRDYVFLSLGSNRRGNLRTAFNIVLVMTAIGLWHGPSWTFVLWGAYFGVLQAVHVLLLRVWPRRKKRRSRVARFVADLCSLFGCRVAVVSSLILFRSEDMTHVRHMVLGLLSGFEITPEFLDMLAYFLLIVIPFRFYEWWQFRYDNPLIALKQKGWVRFAAWFAIAFWGYVLYTFSASMPVGEEFIYFQF